MVCIVLLDDAFDSNYKTLHVVSKIKPDSHKAVVCVCVCDRDS